MNLVAKGIGVFAALLPLVAAPTAGAAVPVPLLAGVPVVNPKYPPGTPADVLIMHPINGWVQGVTGYPPPRPAYLCDGTGNNCENVTWPFPLVPEGVTAFNDAVTTANEPIVVFAYSQGTQIAQQWLKAHLNDPNIPSPNDMTFVLLGNSTRPYGGSLNFLGAVGDVWPKSDYQVVDIARQYEYSADYPTNPLSPFYQLAVLNASLGGWYLHDYTPVENPDVINSPDNTVWKVGNTTYVLIPTKNLPLLEPLRAFGLNALADSLNQPLKDLIDTAYYRDYPNISQPGSVLDTNPTASVSAAAVVPDMSESTVPVTTNSPPTQNDVAFRRKADLPDTGIEEPSIADPSTGLTAPAHRKPGGPLAAARDAISNVAGRSKGTALKGDTAKGDTDQDTAKSDTDQGGDVGSANTSQAGKNDTSGGEANRGDSPGTGK